MPGVVDGWWQAHQYSTRSMGSSLPWKALFGDAIAYARGGFSASAGQRVAPPAEPDLFGPTAIAPIKEHLWPLYHPDALAQQSMLWAVGEELSRRAPTVTGMRVEAKGLAVAVHYRHVAADEIRRVEIELARAMREQGSCLKIFHGTKVIEVLPQVAWTKGECARWIQEHVLPSGSGPALWLYLGDDWTDEYAFEILVGKAVTVRVGEGREPSKADYRISGGHEVERLLTNIASEVVERRAS